MDVSDDMGATLDEFEPPTQPDIMGSSQLGGAPPIQSQDPTQQAPEGRAQRQPRSPDRFTYSASHVRAQRAKRARPPRGG
jgi:hypothetical protein